MAAATRELALFSNLDSDRDGILSSAEMRRLAEYNGFEGSDEEWAEDYSYVLRHLGCPAQGCDSAKFSQLLNDDSDDGLFTSDEELRDMIASLPPLQAAATAGAPGPMRAPQRASGQEAVRSVGLDHFIAERRAGLYDSLLGSWDPQESYRARAPRVGRVSKQLEGCSSSSSAFETLTYFNELQQAGTFGHASLSSSTPEERISQLMTLVGSPAGNQAAVWTTFRIDESAFEASELEELVMAPPGWQIEHESIPQGYLMHILTAGKGNRATCFGGEGLHIVNSVHRDVSVEKPRRLCDTMLIGVVGRKRVILFAPDEFAADSMKPRSPDLADSKLRPLLELPEDQAWSALEGLASREDTIGGVLTLEPGQFVFFPHGWWHAVRPIDDFSFVTGPCHAASVGPETQ